MSRFYGFKDSAYGDVIINLDEVAAIESEAETSVGGNIGDTYVEPDYGIVKREPGDSLYLLDFYFRTGRRIRVYFYRQENRDNVRKEIEKILF